jgi:1-deoxy-D-xylulose 5-phosphate reductoisomerase
VAVQRFLDGSLAFSGIPALAAEAVERYGHGPDPDLSEVIALDAEVRSWAGGASVGTAVR